LPILVAEADGSVTPQQLSELLHQFKIWAARNRLAKCVLVVPSAQAAHITWHDQSAMRLWPVVIGDLTDDQAVAYCMQRLQLWRAEHDSSAVTDEQLQQLASTIVQHIGSSVLDQQRAAAAWLKCSSVDEIVAVCTAHQLRLQEYATDAVQELIYSLKEQSKDAAAVDAFMRQLLDSSCTVSTYDLSLKYRLNEQTVYAVNAACSLDVLRIHPDTGVITLDTKFITEAVRQFLAKQPQ
jgi:hypothetical protein